MRRYWTVVLATLYFLGGIAAWAQFATGASEGLGNLGLLTYVLPVSLIGYGLGKSVGAAHFILVPATLDPVPANAVFFFPSLLLLTYLVGWRLPAIYRRLMAN